MECYRLLLDNLAWIKHQFLSGIRDSRKAGSLWGMMRDMGVVGTVHTIICEELKMRKICAKFVPRVLRGDQKERRCYDSKEIVEVNNSDTAVLDALVTCDESWIYCYDPDTKRQSSQWKHAGSPRPKNVRQSKPTHKLLMIPFFDSTGMIFMHWVPIGQRVNKEYYVKVLRESRKRFRWKR